LRSIPEDRAAFSVVLNPTLNPEEFIESVMVDFGIGQVPEGKLQRLLTLQSFVREMRAKGRTCGTVVDQAPKLSTHALEEVRLLTQFENAERKLLQIVLAGQTELRNILNREELRQLKQRIAVRFNLDPLASSSVGPYMSFRWFGAGAGEPLPFDSSAIQA